MTGPGVDLLEGVDSISSTLVDRIRNHDPEGWRRIVELYEPAMRRWCRAAGLQEADALDVGQEVFRAAFAAIKVFRHDRPNDSFGGWLYTIARNKILDHLRRRPLGSEGAGGSDAREVMLQLAEREFSETSSVDRVADRNLMLRKIAEMVLEDCEEKTRRGFLRIVIGGEDQAEVARSLDTTVNAVRLAKSRLLARIRREYTALVGEE